MFVTSHVGRGSGSACKHLSPPPPTDSWAPEGVHPWGCRAVLCHAVCQAGESCLIARHGARWSHTHTEDAGLSPASRSRPRIPAGAPSPSSLLAGPQRGGPLGAGGQGVGEGMEPPFSRSRPLVSHMSRRCHTHLMWFLAGAAAALLRLIAVQGALQTDNPAPGCPRTPASPALPWLQSPRDLAAPREAQTGVQRG